MNGVIVGRMDRSCRRLIVGMDDFDVVLRMKFILKHQVIIMSSAKCLVITRSTPTIVQTDLRQPKGLRMISVMQLREGLT